MLALPFSPFFLLGNARQPKKFSRCCWCTCAQVRLARWNRLITKAKDALSIHPGHIKLTQFILFVFVLAHMLSCILYGLLDLEEGYSTKWATGKVRAALLHMLMWCTTAYCSPRYSPQTYVIPGKGHVVLACPSVVFMDHSDEVAPNSPTQYVEDEFGVRTGRVQCEQ